MHISNSHNTSRTHLLLLNCLPRLQRVKCLGLRIASIGDWVWPSQTIVTFPDVQTLVLASSSERRDTFTGIFLHILRLPGLKLLRLQGYPVWAECTPTYAERAVWEFPLSRTPIAMFGPVLRIFNHL